MEYSKDMMNWFCELPDTAFLHLANVYSCVETYWTFVLIYWSVIFTYELLCWLLIKLFHPLVLPLGTTTRLSYLNLLVVIIWWSDIPPWKEVSQEVCVPLRCPVAPSTTIDIYECVENLNWLITTERLNWTRHNNHSKFGSVPLNPPSKQAIFSSVGFWSTKVRFFYIFMKKQICLKMMRLKS